MSTDENPHLEPPTVLFRDLNPEDDDGLMEMESLCLNCYEQGVTRLLLTKIPLFREVIISSFSCDHCGHSDRSIQPGGNIQEKGVQYTFTVVKPQDLNRQIVKSDYASFSIPELEFEQIPNRKGEVSTLEGLIDSVISGLQLMQKERMEIDRENAEKVEEFIKKLERLKELKSPFTVVISDPTGNSFIENPSAPHKDDRLKEVHFVRSRQQNIEIGAMADDEDDETAAAEVDESVPDGDSNLNLNNEVLSFAANCPSCNVPCTTDMKVVDIPFFKQVVIMATNCAACGHRDSEVKGGCGIEETGQKITLRLTNIGDLSRDILKSDTCAVLIPELELELVEGTLGGKFTTVEGLLTQIKEQLDSKNPFLVGDSSNNEILFKVKEFCQKLDKIITGETLNVHLVLDDAAGNSYMQNVYAPDDDPEMTVERYTRSFEQNELLGLNDMKTENYSADD